MNNILVVSHERSGTHFLIESILANIDNTIFPRVRPSFLTLENLLLPHDCNITKEWKDFVYSDSQKIKIYKTHLTRDELLKSINTDGYLTMADKNILKEVVSSSKIIYISRKTDDVMYSLYKFMKNGGGLQNSSKIRLKDAGFADFIRMPNYHIMPVRRFKWYDFSLPRYHYYHVESWKNMCDYHITYEQLKDNYNDEMCKLISFFGLNYNESDVKAPPNIPKSKLASLLRYLFFWRRPSYVQPRKGVVGESSGFLTENDRKFLLKEKKFFENYIE